MKRVGRFWACVVAVVVSGCAQADPSESSTTDTLDAGPDAGSLRVTVTTSEISPVANASVQIADSDVRAMTDATGRATFAALAPAQYTVVVARAGYRAAAPKGHVVQIVAGETTEAKMILDPLEIISANNSYHRSLIFRGFISCSAEHISTSGVRNRTQCGNGVDVGGIRVGQDPNDNFSHMWSVENANIQSIVLEAEWTPSFPTLGDQLFIAAQDAFTCSAQSCNYANTIGGKGGKSPLSLVIHEDPGSRITKAIERNAPYPRPVWSVARTYCPPGCNLAITFQQPYEIISSAFYGAPAPAGWAAKDQV